MNNNSLLLNQKLLQSKKIVC